MSISRRSLLCAAGAAATVFGFDPVRRSWVTDTNQAGVTVPALDGQLLLPLQNRKEAATDWGKAVSRLPWAVLKPGSVTDVMEVVRFCRLFGIAVGARGQAHTMYGQSQVGGGVVIDMATLNRIYSLQSDRAGVGAGLLWRDLLLAATAQGLTPPVLTDYLSLSVSGTLSVGGVGGNSYRDGAQIDHVLDLDVVTGRGELVRCSLSQHRDLFEAVLGGLGQCAIIVRATLRLVPAPTHARVFDLVYPDLNTLLADFRTLLVDGRFSYLEGLLPALPTGGFAYILEGVAFYGTEPPDDAALLSGLHFLPGSVKPADLSYFEYRDRLTSVEAAQRAAGRWDLPHPWLDTFLPQSQVEQYVSDALAGLTFHDEPDFGNILYGFHKSSLHRPLFRTPDEDTFFLFDILRTTDPAQVPRAVAENRRLYEKARALGGTLYPISAVPLSVEDWQQHFGPEYGRLLNAKASYDSGRILTPGPGMFA